MPRQRRYFIRNQPLHVIQRGNNRQAIFFAQEDYRAYRRWLGEAAGEFHLAVHAYVLMTNHVHLLVTPTEEGSLPFTMQSLGRRYVGYVNRARNRTGTLWEGRYRAAPIDSDRYFFACCRYIELNPVRARMVEHPREYRWSSYRAHAYGSADKLLSEHALYRALGESAEERQKVYRSGFREEFEADFIGALRKATNGGWAMGSESFKRTIAQTLQRRVAPLSAGRPA